MSKEDKNKPSSEGQPIQGHSYDGIQELDNSLPRWWINGFYLTIAFSAIYLVYYGLDYGDSIQSEYQHSKKAYELAQSSALSEVHVASEEELETIVSDRERIKTGKNLFQTKCVSCHGDQGQGGIGPNLTDPYWIHGARNTDILNTISNGVNDKGMPPWGASLKQEELYAVTAFVKSLVGSQPPGAKSPEGDLVKK